MSLREWQGFLEALEGYEGGHLGMTVSWHGISVGWGLNYSFLEPRSTPGSEQKLVRSYFKSPLDARETQGDGMGRRGKGGEEAPGRTWGLWTTERERFSVTATALSSVLSPEKAIGSALPGPHPHVGALCGTGCRAGVDVGTRVGCCDPECWGVPWGWGQEGATPGIWVPVLTPP